MITYRSRITALLALSLLASACEKDPTGTKEGAFLRATLLSVSMSTTEPIDIRHSGGAEWGGGTKSETQRKLQISSKDAQANRHLMLQRLSSTPGGPFQPGVYTLVPRNFTAGDNDGYTAWYGDSETGNHYIAESGTWTITEVSENGYVTGNFDFIAAYWCNPNTGRDRCFRSPKEGGFHQEAVRLRVQGEFRAEDSGSVPVPIF
jgi:hypothetical protein